MIISSTTRQDLVRIVFLAARLSLILFWMGLALSGKCKKHVVTFSYLPIVCDMTTCTGISILILEEYHSGHGAYSQPNVNVASLAVQFVCTAESPSLSSAYFGTNTPPCPIYPRSTFSLAP